MREVLFLFRCRFRLLLDSLPCSSYGKVCLQPTGNISEGFKSVKLVEHLVARILIKDDLDILHAVAAVQIDRTAHTLTVPPDRVLITRDEQQRQVLRCFSEGRRIVRLGDERKQVAESGRSKHEIAFHPTDRATRPPHRG